jgi:hypothetical protein
MLQCCVCGCRGPQSDFLLVKGFDKCPRCYGQAVRVGNMVGADISMSMLSPALTSARASAMLSSPASTQIAYPDAAQAPAQPPSGAQPPAEKPAMSTAEKVVLGAGVLAAVGVVYALVKQ